MFYSIWGKFINENSPSYQPWTCIDFSSNPLIYLKRINFVVKENIGERVKTLASQHTRQQNNLWIQIEFNFGQIYECFLMWWISRYYKLVLVLRSTTVDLWMLTLIPHSGTWPSFKVFSVPCISIQFTYCGVSTIGSGQRQRSWVWSPASSFRFLGFSFRLSNFHE